MTETALILVDIQNDYFEHGNWPVAKMATASTNATKLLDHARKSGQLVVHIHHEIPSDDAPFFRPGTDGARIHASVAPQDLSVSENPVQRRAQLVADAREEITLRAAGGIRGLFRGLQRLGGFAFLRRPRRPAR